jgi:hypothetical protein
MCIASAVLLILTAVPPAAGAEKDAGASDGTDVALITAEKPLRDPFWPVGYKPKWSSAQKSTTPVKAVTGETGTDWSRAMEQISIQGVSSRADNDFYAIINGEVKSEGETVSVQVGLLSYTWMIEEISPPSSVKLRRVTVDQVALNEENTTGR